MEVGETIGVIGTGEHLNIMENHKDFKITESHARERKRQGKKLTGHAHYEGINRDGKTQRNEPCICGSGKKYKQCCLV